ncbi:MAG: hypothetical protein AAF944_06055 [Bacteroidota bacterium]
MKLFLFFTLLAVLSPTYWAVAQQTSPTPTDSLVSVPITDQYRMGSFGRFMYGDNYREEWSAPVPLRVFDIDREKGGLTIVQRGGGGKPAPCD